ncbi:MAG: DUF2809 domain-containing protein [Nonlabens sp.]|uniref:ribosomal maturation YjgA family protein n=1 Tax=Nonlabens sp. TaxID=1888209 RepID=UPI003EF8DD7A
MNIKRSPRVYYLIAAILLFAIEVCIALFVNDSFVRPFLGDVLVVGLLYCFFMAVTSHRILHVAIFTLMFSYLVETAQYLQIIDLLGLREYSWARIIIGTSFSWWDMLCYTIGFAIILIIEKYKGVLK